MFNIFHFRCINGVLKDKLKILVTHQVQYLQYATSIYTMTEVSEFYRKLKESFSTQVSLLHYIIIYIRQGKAIKTSLDHALELGTGLDDGNGEKKYDSESGEHYHHHGNYKKDHPGHDHDHFQNVETDDVSLPQKKTFRDGLHTLQPIKYDYRTVPTDIFP